MQRRPLVAAVGLAAALAAAAIPFLHVNFGLGDPRTLPAESEGRQVAASLAADFPGLRTSPVQVVTELSANDARVTAYAADLARHLGRRDLVARDVVLVITHDVNDTAADSGRNPGAVEPHLALRLVTAHPGRD